MSLASAFFAVACFGFATMVWHDVVRLAQRLIAVKERGAAPVVTTTKAAQWTPIASSGYVEPEAQAFALDADEPTPATLNPIAQALDDVCGEGAHSDQRLRRHLNATTIPALKAEKLSDEEIAQRIRDGAE